MCVCATILTFNCWDILIRICLRKFYNILYCYFYIVGYQHNILLNTHNKRFSFIYIVYSAYRCIILPDSRFYHFKIKVALILLSNNNYETLQWEHIYIYI